MKSKDERILMRELAGSPEEWCPSPARLRAASRASGKLRGKWEIAGQRDCPCRAGGGVVLSGTPLSPQTVWRWDFCRARGKVGLLGVEFASCGAVGTEQVPTRDPTLDSVG